MATGPAIEIFCGVPAGWLAGRIGAPRVTVMGLGLLSATFALALFFALTAKDPLRRQRLRAI